MNITYVVNSEGGPNLIYAQHLLINIGLGFTKCKAKFHSLLLKFLPNNGIIAKRNCSLSTYRIDIGNGYAIRLIVPWT